MTGTFALTFDTELIWGSFDTLTPTAFEQRYPDVRGTIAAILDLLDRYDVPATWAVVGHLFLERCERGATGLPHAELTRPAQRWRPGDWYASDPCSDRAQAPLWYGNDVVDAIQAARVGHEIGCHSFSHALYGDPDLTRAAVDDDLGACVRLAAARGLTLRSFVFPRNVEGHHEALRAHGFTAFRGADPVWHAALPGAAGRGAHLADQVAGIAPPVSRPSERLPGLWNVPGSALVMHRSGIRRAVPMVSRLRKARLGLRKAAEQGAVFHLWTHPFNLAADRPFMLELLDGVLRQATAARERGEITIATMAAIAEREAGAAADRPAT